MGKHPGNVSEIVVLTNFPQRMPHVSVLFVVLGNARFRNLTISSDGTMTSRRPCRLLVVPPVLVKWLMLGLVVRSTDGMLKIRKLGFHTFSHIISEIFIS